MKPENKGCCGCCSHCEEVDCREKSGVVYYKDRERQERQARRAKIIDTTLYNLFLVLLLIGLCVVLLLAFDLWAAVQEARKSWEAVVLGAVVILVYRFVKRKKSGDVYAEMARSYKDRERQARRAKRAKIVNTSLYILSIALYILFLLLLLIGLCVVLLLAFDLCAAVQEARKSWEAVVLGAVVILVYRFVKRKRFDS